MDWSAKQSRILTANGLAISRYHTAERGYPVIETDLPHHHLQRGAVECHESFVRWRRRDRQREQRKRQSRRRHRRTAGESGDHDEEGPSPPSSIITGAWRRTLFDGCSQKNNEFTSDADETVHNLQTPSLFVDLRIPTTRPRFGNRSSIEELTDDELRLYARQHVFAGYTLLSEERSDLSIGGEIVERVRPVATRHHCVDWNFVGWNPRKVPNRWYVEVDRVTRVEKKDCAVGPSSASTSVSVPVVQEWNEWSYATDDHGQPYYLERWERLGGDESGRGRVLALKRRPAFGDAAGFDDDRDGVLVVVGDHFSYVRGRSPSLLNSLDLSPYRSCGSLVDLVDEAVARGDRVTAEAFLSVEAGHGRIDGGGGGDDAEDCGGGENNGGGGRWRIDSAIPPWREGSCLFYDGEDDNGDGVRVEGRSVRDLSVVWDGVPWDVFECSGIETVEELRKLFETTSGSEEVVCGRADVNGAADGISRL